MREGRARDWHNRRNRNLQQPVRCDTIDLAMGDSMLCTDCPECGSEIIVDLGTAHRLFSDNEKMMYRLVCSTCGLAFDMQFEDLLPRENSDM